MQTTVIQPAIQLEQTLTTEEYKSRVKAVFPKAKFKFINVFTFRREIKYGLVCVGEKSLCKEVKTADQAWKEAYEFVSKAVKLPLTLN